MSLADIRHIFSFIRLFLTGLKIDFSIRANSIYYLEINDEINIVMRIGAGVQINEMNIRKMH